MSNDFHDKIYAALLAGGGGTDAMGYTVEPSLVAITPLLGRHRLITQLRGCATRHVFLRTIAGGACKNQRIFMHIQTLYRNIFYCES
jgi:hypothetical protein